MKIFMKIFCFSIISLLALSSSAYSGSSDDGSHRFYVHNDSGHTLRVYAVSRTNGGRTSNYRRIHLLHGEEKSLPLSFDGHSIVWIGRIIIGRDRIIDYDQSFCNKRVFINHGVGHQEPVRFKFSRERGRVVPCSTM